MKTRDFPAIVPDPVSKMASIGPASEGPASPSSASSDPADAGSGSNGSSSNGSGSNGSGSNGSGNPAAGEPAIVGQVLELFRERLAEVAFPDVSAQSLSGRASQWAERQAAVTRARAELRVAECALEAERAALVELAERAIAYARIYASGDRELEAALETFGPARAGRGNTGRGRAKASGTVRAVRPRRGETPEQTSLPSADPAPAALSGAAALSAG